MARQDKPPGNRGPVCRMPWSDGGFPSDWKRASRRGRNSKGHRTPKPGGRTGPVRMARR